MGKAAKARKPAAASSNKSATSKPLNLLFVAIGAPIIVSSAVFWLSGGLFAPTTPTPESTTLSTLSKDGAVQKEEVQQITKMRPPPPPEPPPQPEEKVRLTFENTASVPADLWWDPVDGQMSSKILSAVPPGESMGVDGFRSHVFVWREPRTSKPFGAVRADRGSLTLTSKMVAMAPSRCFDKHQHFCAARARVGECENAPGWMTMNCAGVCTKLCALRDPIARCVDGNRFNMTPALPNQPNELHGLFERMLASEQYRVTTHSRPETYAHLEGQPGPWVVTIDDFVAEEEGAALLKQTLPNVLRSSVQGEVDSGTGEQEKMLSDARTSENAWCRAPCEADPKVKRLLERIEALVGVKHAHFESIQVLSYKGGQKYNAHYDYPREEERKHRPPDGSASLMPSGPRLLTVFLYLADVTEGGQTKFVDLNPPIAVTPVKGRALVWANVLDEDHMKADVRVRHAALPPADGHHKLAANVWVRLREYQKPNLWGCTGSFD